MITQPFLQVDSACANSIPMKKPSDFVASKPLLQILQNEPFCLFHVACWMRGCETHTTNVWLYSHVFPQQKLKLHNTQKAQPIKKTIFVSSQANWMESLWSTCVYLSDRMHCGCLGYLGERNILNQQSILFWKSATFLEGWVAWLIGLPPCSENPSGK